MSMATANKEKEHSCMEEDEEEDKIVVAKIGDEAAKKRRLMNGSGFFVFNAEDIKNMTEMSPKNKSGRINFKTYGIDYEVKDSQTSSRVQPIIKAHPIFEPPSAPSN